MSYKPPVTGRVKSIKSKFENLSTFDSLDISSSCISHFAVSQPRTSFLFKRSATSIELPAQKCRDKLTGNLRRHNNVTTADTFALKNRNTTSADVSIDRDGDTLKPLKEIKENVEIRLNRHTTDPVKRGSIKRSPAFRVGDKGGKGVLQRSNSPLIKKETADKFDDLLRRCSTDAEKLQEVGLTDTLKAVLKQPLPTGPPPKKPPRTFIDSPSPRENRKPAQIFARAAAAAEEDTKKRSTLPPKELQNKINFLENELVLKPSGRTKNVRSNIHVSPTKTKPFGNSLLKCIPCSSTPVYDTMTISRRTSELPQQPRTDANRIVDAVSSTSKLITQSLDKPKKNVSEHIYMEPFAHLKLTNFNNNNNTSNNNNHHSHLHQHNHNHSSSNNSCVPDPTYVGEVQRTSMPFSYPNASVESIRSVASAPPPSLPPLQHNGSSVDDVSLDSSHISCTSCAADDHSMSDLSGDIHYLVSSSMLDTSYNWAHGILGIIIIVLTRIVQNHNGNKSNCESYSYGK